MGAAAATAAAGLPSPDARGRLLVGEDTARLSLDSRRDSEVLEDGEADEGILVSAKRRAK